MSLIGRDDVGTPAVTDGIDLPSALAADANEPTVTLSRALCLSRPISKPGQAA